MEISVKSFVNAEATGSVKGSAILTFDKLFVVKNLTIVEGKNGMFVNMPNRKTGETGDNGKAVYQDTAFPLTKELREAIQKAAIESFNTEAEVIIDTASVEKQKDRRSIKGEVGKYKSMDGEIKLTMGTGMER